MKSLQWHDCPGTKPRPLPLQALERLKEQTQNFPGGQPDEDMLRWFLRDRSLDVEEAVEKLRKVTAWRQQVRPDALSEDDVFHQISTGRGYLHDHLDLAGRPVVAVRVAKHFSGIPLDVEPLNPPLSCPYLVYICAYRAL